MSIPVVITLDNPDPDECPTTQQEATDSLRERLSAEIEQDFLTYVTGAAIPAVEDQDKVWHRVDAMGRPVGTYVFYSGAWRKQYAVPVGTIAMYSGDPAIDFAGGGHAGTIGSDWDGWQLCTGENGSPNLSDKFIVAAKMDDLGVGYPNGDGPWTTSVTGESLASGDGGITLNAENTYEPPTQAVRLGRWSADSNAPTVGGGLIGLASGSDETVNFNLIDADPGNPTPPAIPTIPPFLALAFVIFQGYP